MFLFSGVLLMLGIILTALHITIKNATMRMIAVILLSALMFIRPSLHTVFLAVLMVSCEIIINKLLGKMKNS